MAEELKRFTLRIDYELYEKLAMRAIKNRRSVTKEIEYIIAKALEESNK